jgi:hypothetical protein
MNHSPSLRYKHNEKSRRKPPPPASQTAKVIELAESKIRNDISLLNANKDILRRVQRCLALGKDPCIPESLAQTAFRQASRMMAEHNVTQAEVLAYSDTADDEIMVVGQTTVAITKTNGRKPRFFNTHGCVMSPMLLEFYSIANIIQ